MCNDAINWRISINICCFISDFRSVVNFNYVGSPKCVPSRKDFKFLAACSKLSKIFHLIFYIAAADDFLMVCILYVHLLLHSCESDIQDVIADWQVEERAKYGQVFETLRPVDGRLHGDKVRPVSTLVCFCCW